MATARCVFKRDLAEMLGFCHGTTVAMPRIDTTGPPKRSRGAGTEGERIHMLGGIITILGGILAASGFIIKRLPNAQGAIDKIAPYQGWIGVVMFGWGVWETIHSALGITLLSTHPLQWVFWLLSGVADLLVGFLLGFGLITHYALSKNPTALAKGQKIRGTLMSIQAPLGLLAMVMGALYIVWLYVI
jgi:hypothetical protein